MGRTRKDRSYPPERSCGKWRYRTRGHAERTRKRRLSQDGEQLFVYGCVECGGFHLTSGGRRKRGRAVSQTHPDFDQAPPAVQWSEPLPALFAVLSREAYQAHGRWVSRVLPRGAWVQMCVNIDDGMRLELRIARRQAPTDDGDWQRWHQEVATFRSMLAPDLGRRWCDPVHEKVRGGVTASMIALFTDEVSKGQVKCADCPVLIPFDRRYSPNRCNACALRAGKQPPGGAPPPQLQLSAGDLGDLEGGF